MRKRTFKSGISLLLAAAMASGSMAALEPVKAAEPDASVGTTYYIDASAGDDANQGTSEDAAWKTFANVSELTLGEGDQVLLKAGCTWNVETEKERLVVKEAAGTEENPVVIGKYGEGADPVINGNGNPWQTDTSAPKEDVAAVHVYNSKYITIQDLEVTNWEEDAADLLSSGKTYEQSKYLLTGILVENHDAGDLPGVVIRNNYVHDVNGYMSKNGTEGDKKGSGGIMALVTGGATKSYFSDLKILGNEVENVCHEAIYMESCWAARDLVGGADSQQAGAYEWVGWPDVFVENNYVHDVAGDGIVLINCDGGVAQNNLILRSASEDWDYSNNPAHAAIWMWDCNNVTMQYNEAAYTTSTQDGMAFDCDYGNQNVMYQYNYSHDNKGGFWMACPGPYYTVNAVVRYNISVNDGLFDGSRIIRVGEYGSIGHQVYNNTIYWDTGYEVSAVEQGSWGTPPTSGTDIYNNIFYGSSGTFVDNAGTTYDSNCVWGAAKDSYLANVDDANAVIADPKFVDTDDYTAGSFADGTVTLGTADGFRLQADSYCINSGRSHMAVPEESFDKVSDELVPTQITLENKDYAGNAVPYRTGSAATELVDIGAFEYQGESAAEAVSSDKAWLQSVTELADTYEEKNFTADTWTAFTQALASAKAALNRSNVTQAQVDANAKRLEEAMTALKKTGSERPGTAMDDILASYATADTVDNSGFEKSSFDWGYWQASRELSTEQAHSGSQSLKITKDSGQTTGYSELGSIPVQANTTYVCEAWVYCSDDEASKVGLEAKHHNSYTSTGSDIKLANASAALDGAEDEWKKIVMEFTTQEYEKISLAVSCELDSTYLDDVIIYPKTIVSGESLDRAGILAALTLVPERQESYYAPGTWRAYQDALYAAKLLSIDAMAEQEELDQQVLAVNQALAALTKKANNTVLAAICQAYAGETQGNYTAASWNAYQTAYQNALKVAADADASQTEVDNALAAFVSARSALTVSSGGGQTAQTAQKAEQTLAVKDAYEKAYGDQAFNLSVKLTAGNGSLAFASSDEGVASVSPNGRVTIRGTGICSITVSASATAKYNAKTAVIKVTVSPAKAALKSVKAAKGKKLTVKWTKDKNASGYQIQYSTKKNFKSGTKTVTVKKASASSTTIKKLKAGKSYYVRIRAYKDASADGGSATLYGAWSKAVKSSKVKK